MIESETTQISTTTPDLRKEAEELKELIQEVRSRFDLPPIFRAKRTYSTIQQDNSTTDEEASLPSKKIMTETTIETNIDNKQDLMTRLSTFSTNFHAFRRPVSALECAKHGWKETRSSLKNDDPDTCVLSCDTCCQNLFVLPIKHKASENVLKLVKEKYQSGLFSAHKDDCQWRLLKCDDSVYCFPLVTISSGLEKLKDDADQIISACVHHKQPLPTLHHTLDDRTLAKLTFFANQQTKHDIDNAITAYILSLHGWESLHPDIPGLKCELCFSRKAFYLMDKPFDVLGQHRDYCPYVNPENANAYTPKGFSMTEGKKISGVDWMKDVLSLEYVILIKSKDLSITYEDELDKKIQQWQQTA